MKVRTTAPSNPATIDSLRNAQTAWLEAEYNARAAFALTRLDALDKLDGDLLDGDLFDAAYAIWDDYIDGRRVDERFESLTLSDLTEQASIFARLAVYLSPEESLSLARAAWGSLTFEIFLANPLGSIFGKLGWYGLHGRLSIRRVPALVGATVHGIGYDIDIRKRRRGAVEHVTVHHGPVHLALHPLFGNGVTA